MSTDAKYRQTQIIQGKKILLGWGCAHMVGAHLSSPGKKRETPAEK
jgi:hypothetical protein